ncbi:hypothetical protein [Amycolatopsis sp. cmx-11-51]|uniref:hypothetical protein n=1 Tax=unclassified Amycolatopsis TaxID=2618356 RepID=UPI0039E648C7
MTVLRHARIAEPTGLSTGAVTGVMDRLEPLFESAYSTMKALFEEFSSEERKVLECFQSALLDGLRDELPGTSSHP